MIPNNTLLEDTSGSALVNRTLAFVPALRAWFSKRASQVDLDDLVQDVLLRMQVRKDAGTIENVEAYLFQVASAVLTDRGRRDSVRQRSMHEEMREELHPIEENSPENVVQCREELALMTAALEALPERTRDVFVLHRFENMRYSAIATHLGISVSAVEKHMMKAMRFLSERLKALR